MQWFKSTLLMLSLPALLFVSACGDDDGGEDPIVPSADVKLVGNATLGNIMTDGEGNSLYFFSEDVAGQPTCEGACLENWPVFFKEDLQVGEGLDANLFTTVTRSDGSRQIAYNGWPLYYFVNDAAPGETNGDGAQEKWFVAKPNYSLMYALAQLVGEDGKQYNGNYEEGPGLTPFITDFDGNTLYIFVPDRNGISQYILDPATWPVFYEELQAVPSILSMEDFDMTTDNQLGVPQLTYKGWPLYYFQQDNFQRGSTKGVSFPQPGIWPIANTDLEEAQAGPNVKLAGVVDLGAVIADARGRTLYFFSEDVNGESACEGDCLTTWPVFYREELQVGEGLDAAKFSSITREDGAKQTTYDGWPLYYFAGDTQPGDAEGEGVGDKWFVAKNDYSLMYAQAQLVGIDGVEYNSNYEPGQELTYYITDAQGRTLYTWVNDTKDKNNFTEPDFENGNNKVWPIFETVDLNSIPSILNENDFGSIDVHGRKQLTYKGWPLYYYGDDNQQRGSNKGIAFPEPGVWPIANKDTAPAQ